MNRIRNTDYKNSKSTNVHEMLEIMVQGLSQKTKSLIQGTVSYKFYINHVDYEENKLQITKYKMKR